MSVKVKRMNVVIGVLLSVSATMSVAPVKASEWGCEVLLCAAASNPSWRGVASCHPPMTRLISAMKKPGFDWPTCPAAGTGSPGFERYAACPKGYQVGSRQDRNGFGREQNLCIKTVNMCQSRTHNSDRQQGCIQRSPYPDRSSQSPISLTSRMKPQVKPSGIGSSSTNKHF